MKVSGSILCLMDQREAGKSTEVHGRQNKEYFPDFQFQLVFNYGIV